MGNGQLIMKTQNVLKDKSFLFALRVIKCCKFLQSEKKEFVLSKQILRSGTSIGANIEEAIGGQSNADFFHKLSISYKEARETVYWLKLLQATNYLTDELANSLINDCNEICKIIGKIQTTLKARNS